MSNLPSVSVCVIAYNQEYYIRETLDSIVQQVTNFRFEIIVSDDCSTDKTRLIIDEFYNNFTNNIHFHTIHSNINLGYKKNFRKVLEAATGKYIAICEGDDYWTDPYKLQKQFEQLEENPSCILSFHNVSILNSLTGESILSNNEKNGSIFNMLDVINTWNIMTSSIMFRRSNFVLPTWFDYVFNTDYALLLILASTGRSLIYLNDNMSVYRKHPNGVSNTIWGSTSILWLIYLFIKINHFSKGVYRIPIRKKIHELEKELMLSNSQLYKNGYKKYSYYRYFHYRIKNIFLMFGMTHMYLRGFKRVHHLK